MGAAVYLDCGGAMNDAQARVLTSDERRAVKAHLRDQLTLAAARGERGGWRMCRDATLSWMLLDMGMRGHEARLLCWHDVDLVRGDMVIRKGKNGLRRVHAIPKTVKKLLKEWRARQEWGPDDPVFPGRRTTPAAMHRDSVRRAFQRELEAIGLDAKHRGAHAARHSLGRALYVATGGDLLAVADALGHVSLDSTRIYARKLPSEVAAAIDDLDLDE